jgi:OmcA/MtrC family decaheme c-type cytochrome
MKMQPVVIGISLITLITALGPSASGATKLPDIKSIARPAAGFTQIIFHGPSGPFRIQARETLDPAAAWVDMPEAIVTELAPGVYMGQFANGRDDLAFYRIVSEAEGITELKGWTIRLQSSTPANGAFFVAGESPIVTVTILDTFAQGITRADLSSLNLYMYGPQDPRQTVTAVKLLNASTDRSKNPHHYIDLKTNPDVQVTGTVLTYRLKPVTDEAPGTYTISLWARLAADNIQQVMRFANVQIGTAQAEQSLFTDARTGSTTCADCHEGAVSGKLYLHHIDPGFSPTGNWSLDYEPGPSCKSCHNNDGYAAYADASAPGGRVVDPLVRRVHGVHMGEGLKLPFNTNATTGDFRHYRHVIFPAEIRNCTKCHVDDRWKTQPTRMACGSCHDTLWFGTSATKPADMEMHGGGTQTSDTKCSICHAPDPDPNNLIESITENHKVPTPGIDDIEVTLTPPANGTNYVAGEAPVITLVFKDDSGNPIDHTKVTDVNFSTASLYVYGPRARAVPVLTSAAKNVNSKLRASVTSSKAGPWAIKGKVFKIAVNGSAPLEITIDGAADLVTAAEVVSSLNTVITNLNAKASVSGANVNMRTTIQGAQARFEIYNGDVTTAMGWKRAPNTTMEPDITIAAGSLPSNDLRGLADPLDFSDPKVTRTAANITYQLDDVTGLAPGTYHVYVYHLPRAGKIAGMAAATGVGHYMFLVGTATPDKKVATNCTKCHADSIWHFYEGPIHAEPFDTDFCNACHDYGHTTRGDMFKNQGGTSLSGWSGFGAMPIVRRVHGLHYAHYLEHSEEIYANATKDTFGGIIFPQDVRNCTICHAESDTWKQKPSRMACLACHDSDAAKAHGKLMTWMPDPNDPYGPASVESCEVCHGAGTEWSPDKVHSISNPYVPPYPREP